jgi:hypothetical protein
MPRISSSCCLLDRCPLKIKRLQQPGLVGQRAGFEPKQRGSVKEEGYLQGRIVRPEPDAALSMIVVSRCIGKFSMSFPSSSFHPGHSARRTVDTGTPAAGVLAMTADAFASPFAVEQR